MNYGDWIAVAGALIALLALFRPEWAIFLQRLYGRGHVYLAGKVVEVGFVPAGTMIAVDLVLRAERADFFVREGRLEVVREQDGARYTLDWAAVRAGGLNLPHQGLEQPAGFLLEPRNPRRLSIIFNDGQLEERMTELLFPLRESYTDTLRQLNIHQMENPEERQQAIETFYHHAQNSDPWRQVWATIQRLCYWREGVYRADIVFVTAQPEVEFRESFGFSLTDRDVESLLANVVVMQRRNVGFEDWTYNVARPRIVRST